MTILDTIREHKERELAQRQASRPLAEVERASREAPPPISFADALRRPGVQLIAEVKRRSPARGDLKLEADAPSLAAVYFDAGAAAVSVLTDRKFFSGHDSDLQEVRGRVRGPLLRKDFTIDPYQIHEARGLGADAVLLIASLLTDEQLRDFLECTHALGMEAIVETHTEDEVDRAVAVGARVIGINNRDLATFTVDIGTTERLAPRIPPDRIVISESGIMQRDDVVRAERAGARAVLVGEALVTAQDAGVKLRELLGDS